MPILQFDLTILVSIIDNYYSIDTGKPFSEALIELQVQYMKITSSEHGENMGRTCC